MKTAGIEISVLITSHNSDQLLLSALTSVYAQSYPAAEVIIVDDASTTPTKELLANIQHSPKILRTEFRSQGAATNFAIRNSTFEFLALLDHDDYWPLDKLQWQVELMLETEADVVVGSVINEWLLPDGQTRTEDMGIARVFGSCLIKKSAFTKVGDLDETGQIHEVIDWWSRAGNQLKVVTDQRVGLIRRIHGKNMTLAKEHEKNPELLARLRSHLSRLDG